MGLSFRTSGLQTCHLTLPGKFEKCCVGGDADKMLCSYQGTFGVGLSNQPLSALMEEKLRTKGIKEGLISMKGDIKVHKDNSDDVDLIEPIAVWPQVMPIPTWSL